MSDEHDDLGQFKEKKLIDKYDSIKHEFNKVAYEAALREAAEEWYQSEMVDTNMESVCIREIVKDYGYYANEKEKQQLLDQCDFDTKEDCIKAKIDEWLTDK